MMSKHRATCAELNGEEEAKLVEPKGRILSTSSIAVVDGQTTSTLQAKNFPLRDDEKVNWTLVYCFAWALLIFGLSYFASKVHNLVTGHSDAGNVNLDNVPVCDLVMLDGTAQTAFSINIRGPDKLSFVQAKAIDVVWQLSVGAGGRFLMGWLAYKAFMDGLTRLMEHKPVSYDLYATLTFSTTSLLAVWQATKTVYSFSGWRGKCFMMWFAVSTIYILGFQALISATAGYVQPSTLTLQLSDGRLINFGSENLTACFVFFNAERVGLPNDTVVNGPQVKDNVTFVIPLDSHAEESVSRINSSPFNTTYPDYRDLANSKLARLRPNCTSFLGFGEEHCHVTFRFRNQTHELPYGDGSQFDFNIATCYNSKPLNLTDAKNSVKCLPEPYFVWGLSSLLLKIVLALQTVWVFGMYMVWIDANLASELCRMGAKFVDLSEPRKT